MTQPTDSERAALMNALEHYTNDPSYQGDSTQMRCLRLDGFTRGWQAARSQPTKQAVDVDPATEAFPHCYIGSLTFQQWKEFAKRDNCLDGMVPSDLRMVLGFVEKMQKCAEYWRDSISEDKRESNKLRAQLAAMPREAGGVDEKLQEALALLWFWLPENEPADPHSKKANDKERNKRWHRACELYREEFTK